MSDGIWYGLAIGIMLFVIIPCLAILAANSWHSRDRPQVDWIAYGDSIRPAYTTICDFNPKCVSRPLPLLSPVPTADEYLFYGDTEVVEVRDWGFAQDIYLADGRLIMNEMISKQIYRKCSEDQ